MTLGSGDGTQADLKSRTSVIIGRDPECDVVVQDRKASRQHCRLSRSEGAFLLEDLGSRNGTYVNGERITQAVTLRANQTFQIGDTMFYLGK